MLRETFDTYVFLISHLQRDEKYTQKREKCELNKYLFVTWTGGISFLGKYDIATKKKEKSE